MTFCHKNSSIFEQTKHFLKAQWLRHCHRLIKSRTNFPQWKRHCHRTTPFVTDCHRKTPKKSWTITPLSHFTQKVTEKRLTITPLSQNCLFFWPFMIRDDAADQIDHSFVVQLAKKASFCDNGVIVEDFFRRSVTICDNGVIVEDFFRSVLWQSVTSVFGGQNRSACYCFVHFYSRKRS